MVIVLPNQPANGETANANGSKLEEAQEKEYVNRQLLGLEFVSHSFTYLVKLHDDLHLSETTRVTVLLR